MPWNSPSISSASPTTNPISPSSPEERSADFSPPLQIKNQKSKIKNQKSKIKNQKSKIKNQKSPITDHRST
jgi:hypothetical protein